MKPNGNSHNENKKKEKNRETFTIYARTVIQTLKWSLK